MDCLVGHDQQIQNKLFFLSFLAFSPIFVFAQASSLAQLTKAIQALMTDYEDDLEVFGSEAKVNESEKIDALEVKFDLLMLYSPALCAPEQQQLFVIS